MRRNYTELLKQLNELYLGEIRTDAFLDFYKEWAEKNNYSLSKCFKLLTNTAYNSKGDIIPIVEETEEEIYYNDSCHRYCYLNKSEEGKTFEYCT